MAPALFLAIVGLFMGIAYVLPWPQSDGLLLAAQLVAGAALLFGPIFVYAAIATWLDRRAVTAIAKAWCARRDVAFERAELHKNHHAVVFREGTKTRRAKFRVEFVPTTWLVREVTWL